MANGDLMNLHHALVDVALAQCRSILPREQIFVLFPTDRITIRDNEHIYAEIMPHEWIVSDSAQKRLAEAVQKTICDFVAHSSVSYRFVTGD